MPKCWSGYVYGIQMIHVGVIFVFSDPGFYLFWETAWWSVLQIWQICVWRVHVCVCLCVSARVFVCVLSNWLTEDVLDTLIYLTTNKMWGSISLVPVYQWSRLMQNRFDELPMMKFFTWIMPLVQDQSLNLFTSSPARYLWATDKELIYAGTICKTLRDERKLNNVKPKCFQPHRQCDEVLGLVNIDYIT